MSGSLLLRVAVACGLLLVVAVRVRVQGECNTCSGYNSMMCVSPSQYKFCVDNLPAGTANSCPTNYVCSTANSTICQLNSTDVAVDCTSCNTCDATNVFACTGSQTYALCLGNTEPSTVNTGSCAEGYVCNTDYPQICVDSTTFSATCSSDETVTTEAPSVSDPVAYCQAVQEDGRFLVGNLMASTCTQYIYCFYNNGAWTGALYYCPGTTYFNETSRLCEVSAPTRCY